MSTDYFDTKLDRLMDDADNADYTLMDDYMVYWDEWLELADQISRERLLYHDKKTTTHELGSGI